MIVDVNVDDLPESDAVPVGQYKFRVDEVKGPGVDKNQGKFIGLNYSIIEGEFTARKVSENYIPLQGRAILRKILTALGYNQGEKLVDTDDLIGKEFYAMTKVEPDTGFGEQTKIAVYLAPDAVLDGAMI